MKRNNKGECRQKKIFISSFAEDSLKVAQKYNFGIEINHTCISDNLDLEKREDVLSWIENDLKKAGIALEAEPDCRRYILHGPFTDISPSAIDSRALKLTYERMIASIEIAKTLFVDKVILHTGFFPFLFYPDWHREKSITFWKRIDKYIPKGMTICVENVFEENPILFADIFHEVASDRIKLCMDIGHAHCMSSPDWSVQRWIEYLGKDIAHFHLHNNFGENKDLHQPIMEGSMDIVKVLDAIDKFCGSEVTMTIESKQAESSAEFLKEYYGL